MINTIQNDKFSFEYLLNILSSNIFVFTFICVVYVLGKYTSDIAYIFCIFVKYLSIKYTTLHQVMIVVRLPKVRAFR
jgi:hypothetical protein